MEGFRPLESGVPYFDQKLSIFLGATWTLCARWRYCMLEGWHFFLENTRHEGSIWFLQDIVRVFANIPSTIPQPFPKRSGKSPLMWGSCYCHPHAAGALGEGHLESEMVSPGGRHPNKSMVFVSSFFSHEKYENKQRHCSSLRCRWAEKNSEHLQFKAPKTTPWIHLWDADPVPIGYVSIQGSHIFTVADDHLPSGKLT